MSLGTALYLLATSSVLLGIYGEEPLRFDEAFKSAWSVTSGRSLQPKCVDIPTNFTLCHSIGYDNMRIPNLLEHDNLEEATTQADNWKPLIGIRCHPDTQVFLCSLFAPICLERVVYPCRSLCESVQKGCEGFMKTYGFPWPQMFKCDQFPTDDQLCVPGPSGTVQKADDRVCQPCKQADTYEGILDSICKTQFVFRATIKGLNQNSKTADLGQIEVSMGKRKKKFYKRDDKVHRKIYKQLVEKDAKIYISQGMGCTCGDRIVEGGHHLMGVRVEEKYNSVGDKVTRFYADFITSWTENKQAKPAVKKALRAIRKNFNVCQGGLNTLKAHNQVREQSPDRKIRKRDKKQRKQRRRV